MIVSALLRSLVDRFVAGHTPVLLYPTAVDGTSDQRSSGASTVFAGPKLDSAFTQPLMPYPMSMIIAPAAPLFASAVFSIRCLDERRSNPSVPLATFSGMAAAMFVSIRMLRIAGHTR